jgi:hypothetical protein
MNVGALINGGFMYYPSMLKSEFPVSKSTGLAILKEATNVPKLSAMTLEMRPKTAKSLRPKPLSSSKYIKKGKFRGLPMYFLTLQELNTCPDSCALKLTFEQLKTMGSDAVPCYGRNMPFADRNDHESPEFYNTLERDVDYLNTKHPDGFAIRLHELGDFFSTDYVSFWEMLLCTYPALNAFGYSHTTGAIGDMLDMLYVCYATDERPRFAIYDSDNSHGSGVRPTASTIKHVPEDFKPPRGTVVCPQQLKKTASCATCGLCPSGDVNLLFITH